MYVRIPTVNYFRPAVPLRDGAQVNGTDLSGSDFWPTGTTLLVVSPRLESDMELRPAESETPALYRNARTEVIKSVIV